MKPNHPNSFAPSRLVFNETPGRYETSQNPPEKKEVPEDKSAFPRLRVNVTNTVNQAMEITKSFSAAGKEKFTDEQLKTRILFALKSLEVSPAVNKQIYAKFKNAQHVYTIDTGTHLVEVELKPVNETQIKPLVNIYKKSAVPAEAHDVADVKGSLEFKAKTIKSLEALPKGQLTRETIAAAGKKILGGSGIAKIMENCHYDSHHLLSMRLDDGEYVDIRLSRPDNKANKDNWNIVVFPWKAPAKAPTKDATGIKIG